MNFFFFFDWNNLFTILMRQIVSKWASRAAELSYCCNITRSVWSLQYLFYFYLFIFFILIMNTHPCNKNPYVYWIKKSKEKKGTERMKAKEQKFVLMSLRISKYFLKRKKVKIPVYGKLESNFSKLSSFKYL